MRSALLSGLLLVSGPVLGQNIDVEIVPAGTVTDGEGGVAGLGGANGVTVAPDGRHVYVASCRDDSVSVFVRDRATGALTFEQAVFNGKNGVQGLDCAAHVAVSPDGLNAYITGYLSDSIAEFERDPTTGRLEHLTAHFEGKGGVQGLAAPTDILVSPDGTIVMVSSWDNNQVTLWDRSDSADSGRVATAAGLRMTSTTSVAANETQPVTRKYLSYRRKFGVNRPGQGWYDPRRKSCRAYYSGWESVITVNSCTGHVVVEQKLGCSGSNYVYGVRRGALVDQYRQDHPNATGMLFVQSGCGIWSAPLFSKGIGTLTRLALSVNMDVFMQVAGRLAAVNNGRKEIFDIDPQRNEITGDVIASNRRFPMDPNLGDAFYGSGTSRDDTDDEGDSDSDGDSFRGRDSFYLTHPSTDKVSAWNVKQTCKTEGDQLCLGGGRYLATAHWRTKKQSGAAKGVQLTEDTGYFWFFNKNNVEVVLKVHDGCGFNNHNWVFAGGLTDVAVIIKVLDLLTGRVQEYSNNLGMAFQPIRNITAFPGCPNSPNAQIAGSTGEFRTIDSKVEVTSWSTPIDIAPRELGATVIPRATCKASDTILCINQDRFQVEVDWATKKQSGQGHAEEITPDTGYFWFFGKSNIEMVIKVFNGCGNNNNFWVFAGGLTDVEVDITVTDTMTGRKFRSKNPLGSAFRPIRNISSFPCS